MTCDLTVVMKRKYSSNIEIVSQEHSIAVAENKALLAYTDNSAYMVAVIEINPQEIFAKERMNVIFKIERVCKCFNIQRVFNHAFSSSLAKCAVCGLPFGQSILINEDDSIHELVEEDILV